MGQEIFYCAVCKTLLRTRDIEKGQAVRQGDRIYCRACAGDAEPEMAKPVIDETPRPRSGSGVSRTPRAPMPTPAPRSPVPLIAGIAAAVLLVVILAVATSAKPERQPARNDPPPVVEAIEAPKPVPPPPARPDPRPPFKPLDREASARRLLDEARAVPVEDVDLRLDRARRALLEADGTALAEEARRLEAEAREQVRLVLEKRKAELDARVATALAAEKFGEALALLEAAKADARVAEVRKAVDDAWKDAKDKLAADRKRGADVRPLVTRIEGWGVASVREELARLLGEPVEVDAAPELVAYRKRWTEPWAQAAPFDYAAALKELEKPVPASARAEAAGDLEALRLAADLAKEAPAQLQKLVKGQDLRLERFLEDGTREELSGKVLRVGPQEIELLSDEGRLAVALAELTPASWAELYSARAAKKPTDARAAQLYCLLEGDAEGAARFAGEAVPPGPATAAARAGVELRSTPELDARRAFSAAEMLFHDAPSRLGSSAAYAAILKGQASTSFVKRAKPLLEERLQAAQDVFLTADDLSPGGLFVHTEALKGVACLSMSADAPGGRAPENHVQFDLAAPGGEAAPRCWVYAGGCCLEVLSFAVQAPELSGPNPRDAKETVAFEPGSPFAAPVRITAFLKAKHSAHMGPKEASKWAWVNVPLPKYPTPGVRKIRLIADQQGFSIAYVWLSVGRPGPPRETDLKEFERYRAEIAALKAAAPPKIGTLLREWWTDIPGDKVADLLAAPSYPNRPAGSGPLAIFEGPSNIAENYGTRVRGFLHPPLSGNYVFYAATDDDSELWLSTDDKPASRRKILELKWAPKPREWDSPKAGKSGAIPLKAGRRYYVELLHKEGKIDDHFAVGWQLPDGSMERPIPGNRLSPWNSSRSVSPGFYRAINLNGPAMTIDGRPWEGKDAPQFSSNSGGFENQNVPLEPPVDGPKAQMIRSSLFTREGLQMTLQGVPPGRYQVFAYIWEDNASQTFDILLNGRVVKEKHVSGSAGHWERCGPWTVDANDGMIEIRTTPGDANFSGLEFWRVGR